MDSEPSFPNNFQKKTLWRAVTGLAILVIGTLLVGLVWLTSNVLGYFQPVLVPLAVSGIIAYLLDPVVKFLQKKGLSRIKGIIAVFLGFLISFSILMLFIGSRLSTQLNQVTGGRSLNEIENPITQESLYSTKQKSSYGWIAQRFFQKNPEAVKERLENGGTITGLNKHKWYLDKQTGVLVSNEVSRDLASEELRLLNSDWKQPISIDGVQYAAEVVALENFDLTQGGHYFYNIIPKALGWLSSTSGRILGFFGIALGFFMVPIYLYYFLKESDSIRSQWENYVPLKASKFKTEVVDCLREINGYLISFFRGQVLVAFIDGILVGIALSIYGLNYGLLLGICMAFLGIIPYIGNIIVLIPACIIAYFQSVANQPWGLPVWGYILGVLLIFVIVQQINSLLTAPKIVGDSVGLHPMTVIFSMLFWTLVLGGFLGALLAVPMTAAVKVLFRRYVWDRQTLETTG